jgi:hypothetical protein
MSNKDDSDFNSESGSVEVIGLLIIIGIGIGIVIMLTGIFWSVIPPVKPDLATALLTREGYSNIRIGGYGSWSCSEDDYYKTKFKATKNGIEAEGVVCGGFWKGSTIRFYN